MSTWNLPPGVSTNDPHINPPDDAECDTHGPYDYTEYDLCPICEEAYIKSQER